MFPDVAKKGVPVVTVLTTDQTHSESFFSPEQGFPTDASQNIYDH